MDTGGGRDSGQQAHVRDCIEFMMKELGVLLQELDAIPEPRLADASSEPTRLLLAAEGQRTIRDAVAALGEPYREVVALRFFGDLSLMEVAEATGRPLNTVKTHLRRGLERLRPILADGGDR